MVKEVIVDIEKTKEEEKEDKKYLLNKDGGKLKKELRKRKAKVAGMVVGSLAAFYFGVFNPFIKKPLMDALNIKTKKVQEYKQRVNQFKKEKENYTKQIRKIEREKQRLAQEKQELKEKYEKEKAEIVAQYIGSELKDDYDVKIANNIFDLVLVPGDEDYSYLKFKVEKTKKLQLNPENKALSVAVEDILKKFVKAGIITKEKQKEIMENGATGVYEFDNGEAWLKIKQKNTVYQNYLTPDKKESLEKLIFKQEQ